jgi:hypothetical protein
MSSADHALTGEADQQAYTTLLVGWLAEMIRDARADAQTKQVVAKAQGAVTVPP